jgi:hypothetical protein
MPLPRRLAVASSWAPFTPRQMQVQFIESLAPSGLYLGAAIETSSATAVLHPAQDNRTGNATGRSLIASRPKTLN